MIYEASLRQIDYLKYQQNLSKEMVLQAPLVVEVEINNPDISSIKKAVSLFVKRHESVRTVFPLIKGNIKQKILSYNDSKFALDFIDISKIDMPFEAIKKEYINKISIVFADRQNGPLIKFYLVKLNEDKQILYVLIDHIICDAWSKNIIKKELTMFYQHFLEGHAPLVPPLKINLGNYCENQNKWLAENKEELVNFWKSKLSDFYNQFNIDDFYYNHSLDFNNKILKNKTNKNISDQKELFAIYDCPEALLYTVTICGENFLSLKEMSKLNTHTIPSIIYSSLYISLHCYTGKSRILLAAIIADRFTPENKLLIGYLIGSLYLPREVVKDSIISDFINETFFDTLTCCQNLIFSDGYLGLNSPRLRASCDILVNYVRDTNYLPQLDSILEKHRGIPGIFYPLELMIYEYEDGIIFYWKYNKILFTKELMENFVEFHKKILNFIVTNSNETIGEVYQTITSN